MALYAQDSDLDGYDSSIRAQGEDSFEAQLTKASEDILNLIKTAWWPEASGLGIDQFVEANLNAAVLKKITIYKAFYEYIFPMLSKFTEGDVFLKKIDFYDARFKDEWLVVKGLPLYDFDESTTFDEDERRGPIQWRTSRA